MSNQNRFACWAVLFVFLIGGLGGGTSTWSFAGTDRPCADDTEKFCKNVRPGGGRKTKCLKAHAKDITFECRERLQKATDFMKGVHEACADDVEKLCGALEPKRETLTKCFKNHHDELSMECRDKLNAVSAAKGKKKPPKKHKKA